MTKKVMVVLLMLLVIGIVIPGCARQAPTPTPGPETEMENPYEGVGLKPDGTQYEFGQTPPFLFAEFCYIGDEVTKSMFKKAGVKYTSLNPDNDPEAQNNIIDDFILKGVDGITMLAVDSSAQVPAIERAEAAGIPCFETTTPVNTDKITFTVTCGNYAMGRTAGEWLVNYAEETGRTFHVYEFWGAMAMESVHMRHQGFHDAVEGNPLIAEIVQSPDTYWLNDNAMNFLMDVLPANPDINCLFIQGDLVPGIIEGLRVIGRLYPVGHPDHIVVTAIDDSTEHLQAIQDGYFDASSSHSPYELQDACVKAALLKVCCGQDIPKEVTIPTYSIVPENLDQPRYGAPALTGLMQRVNFDLWPVLTFPEELGLPTPTVEMKKSGY